MSTDGGAPKRTSGSQQGEGQQAGDRAIIPVAAAV
jgi:hypothetical protein